VRTRGDTLHMLWLIRAEPRSFITMGVAHTISGDGGRTWSAPQNVPLPAGLDTPARIAAAAGPGGELHLVFSDRLVELNKQLWHTRFLDGWTQPVRLLPDSSRRSSRFVFHIDGSGRLHLLWSHSALYREGDPPGARDVRLSYAVRPLCREDGT
jgi:hypothetical protein